MESVSINPGGDGAQSTGALIQLGLLKPGETEVLSLTEALLFHMKQVETCCNVNLMMFKLLEVDDFG